MSGGTLNFRFIRNGAAIVWTPAMVEAVRILSAEGLGSGKIATMLGMSRNAIVGARVRYGIKSPPRPDAKRYRPDDFAEIGPTLTTSEAQKRYSAGYKTVIRWHEEQGTKPKKAVPAVRPRKQPKPKAPRRRKSTGWVRDSRLSQKPIPSREGTLAAYAQMHLQKFGPCFRAKIIDPQSANDEWIVCGRRFDEPAMIALAQRKGFQVAA